MISKPTIVPESMTSPPRHRTVWHAAALLCLAAIPLAASAAPADQASPLRTAKTGVTNALDPQPQPTRPPSDKPVKHPATPGGPLTEPRPARTVVPNTGATTSSRSTKPGEANSINPQPLPPRPPKPDTRKSEDRSK